MQVALGHAAHATEADKRRTLDLDAMDGCKPAWLELPNSYALSRRHTHTHTLTRTKFLGRCDMHPRKITADSTILNKYMALHKHSAPLAGDNAQVPDTASGETGDIRHVFTLVSHIACACPIMPLVNVATQDD